MKEPTVETRERWFTPGVRGIGAASFLADVGHEIPTALLPNLLTATLGASAAALGLIEGASDGLAGAARLAGRAIADDPQRRRAQARRRLHDHRRPLQPDPARPPPSGRSACSAPGPGPPVACASRPATPRGGPFLVAMLLGAGPSAEQPCHGQRSRPGRRSMRAAFATRRVLRVRASPPAPTRRPAQGPRVTAGSRACLDQEGATRSTRDSAPVGEQMVDQVKRLFAMKRGRCPAEAGVGAARTAPGTSPGAAAAELGAWRSDLAVHRWGERGTRPWRVLPPAGRGGVRAGQRRPGSRAGVAVGRAATPCRWAAPRTQQLTAPRFAASRRWPPTLGRPPTAARRQAS
jgi:hypothetical protein